MGTWHGGKGSSPRQVNKNKFDSNWDRIFKQNTYKEVQQDLTELNGDGNRNRGTDGEDNDKSNSSV